MVAGVADIVTQDRTANQVPALPIQLEGICVAATKDDFIFVADGLVARYIAAHIDLIHRLIELVDDITGDVSGTRCALSGTHTAPALPSVS